jgi:virulence-associated protein VapD
LFEVAKVVQTLNDFEHVQKLKAKFTSYSECIKNTRAYGTGPGPY